MQQALADLAKLVEDNKQLFVDCKIKHAMPTGNVERVSVDKIVNIFDFIHKLLLGPEVEEWRTLKAWQPQERWDRYKIVGLRKTREQVMLREITDKIKSIWRGEHDGYGKRPSFPFGKHYEEETADADGDQEGTADGAVRSEESSPA